MDLLSGRQGILSAHSGQQMAAEGALELVQSMTISLANGKKLDVSTYGLSSDDLPSIDDGPIDLRKWFGQPDLPLELEIGSGKGTFLVQHAAQNLETNFIGIEWAKAFWRYAADRMRRLEIPNVRMVHYEAGSFVRNFIGDKQISRLHVYFPDPWPKKRHHKRRLLQASFFKDVLRTLTDDGKINLATDHEGYFQWMQEHAQQVSDLYTVGEFESPGSAREGELVGTNFERKYREEGRNFYAMTLTKI